MKMTRNFIIGILVALALVGFAAFLGYRSNDIIRAHAEEAESEPIKISWEEMCATEYFEDEVLCDLDEDWVDLKESGFTSYSYDITETDVKGIYQLKIDMNYRDNETVSIIFIYDVYDDEEMVYGLIDGEHVSVEMINDRYGF